ncbi:hypothetical protein HER10_EVM0001101 [Colletotrichum scovillei]|uniref:uncharacterized protein n=1 Tax=Colletotrichum scovillei TaxID=1209932 RepID=UPI0015C38735|nr:uncharacterized protein HER10_EVM0001101 [Colletotrichum scovillei]KAF4775837.1 hypothetical protein HER10_EVM0001101 [Colletotrichum scovillei]
MAFRFHQYNKGGSILLNAELVSNSYQPKLGRRRTADAGPTIVESMVAKTRNPGSSISQGLDLLRPW